MIPLLAGGSAISQGAILQSRNTALEALPARLSTVHTPACRDILSAYQCDLLQRGTTVVHTALDKHNPREHRPPMEGNTNMG
jgi:hypothetical protein